MKDMKARIGIFLALAAYIVIALGVGSFAKVRTKDRIYRSEVVQLLTVVEIEIRKYHPDFVMPTIPPAGGASRPAEQ